MGPYRYEQRGICILYKNCCMRCWRRPRGGTAGAKVAWQGWQYFGLRIPHGSPGLGGQRQRRASPLGVPLTRPLAQECFRQTQVQGRGSGSVSRPIDNHHLTLSGRFSTNPFRLPAGSCFLLAEVSLVVAGPFACLFACLFACFLLLSPFGSESPAISINTWVAILSRLFPRLYPIARSRPVFGGMHPSIAISASTKAPVQSNRGKAVVVPCQQSWQNNIW
ncbi:hypothetical protein V8C26DRAFT_102383 [Trichoderma gracile]